jgi:hypothetical protein
MVAICWDTGCKTTVFNQRDLGQSPKTGFFSNQTRSNAAPPLLLIWDEIQNLKVDFLIKPDGNVNG